MIKPKMGLLHSSSQEGAHIKLPILSEEERNSLADMLRNPNLYEVHEWQAAIQRMLKAFESAEGFIRNQQVHLTRYHRLLRRWFVALHKGGSND